MEMENILSDLGLHELIPRFLENQIKPSDVNCMTETEFIELGVTRIGDRARLRARCKESASGSLASSPIVQKLVELNEQRKGKGKGKDSRREGKDT